MIGYKGCYNSICNNIKFVVGKTYYYKGTLGLGSRGFHFCKIPDDIFPHYSYIINKFNLFEINAIGETIYSGDKGTTDIMFINKIVPISEYNNIFLKYKFDNFGNIISHKRKDGTEALWEYDDKNQLIWTKNYKGYEQFNSYDENGNLIHFKDNSGWEKIREYDDNNREIYYKFIGDGKEIEHHKDYDDSGNLIYYKSSTKMLNRIVLDDEYHIEIK